MALKGEVKSLRQRRVAQCEMYKVNTKRCVAKSELVTTPKACRKMRKQESQKAYRTERRYRKASHIGESHKGEKMKCK